MKNVDLYLKVRHAVRIEGLSERATARRFGIDPRTVNKMMKFSVPPPANITCPALLNAGPAVRAAQPMKRTGRETPAEISWCFHQRCCRPRRRGSA